MSGKVYADTLSAVFNRVAEYETDVETSLAPHQIFQNKLEVLEKRFDDLLKGDPIRDKEIIRQCSYDSVKLKEEYQATAKDQETAFQLSRKETIINLFGELFTILGPALLRETLQRHGQMPLRTSFSSDSLSRKGSATSQSLRATSDSLGASSAGSSVTGISSEADISPNSRSEADPRIPRTRAATEAPRSEKRSRLDVDTTTHVTRVIQFDEVYQDGQALVKHVIIEYPKLSGNWYVVKCDEHSMHFHGENPLSGAGRHLSSKAHNESGAHEEVIRLLGYSVQGCTPELAAKNNQVVKDAMVQEVQRAASTPFKRAKGKKRRREDELELSEDMDWSVDHSLPANRSSRRSEGIVDPVVGDVYLVYWEGDRRWYAGVVLQIDESGQTSVPNLDMTELLDSDKPECYIYDSQSRICGWASGFEDGGPRVLEREFPVMFFDRDKFPESCQTAWMQPRNLKLFEDVTKDVPYGRLVEQYLQERQKRDLSLPQSTLHFADEVKRRQLALLPTAAPTTENTVEKPAESTESVPPSSASKVETPISPNTVQGPPPPTAETASPTPQPAAAATGPSPQTEEPKRQAEEASSHTPTVPTKVENSPTTASQKLAEAPHYQPSQNQPRWSNREPYTVPAAYKPNHSNISPTGAPHTPTQQNFPRPMGPAPSHHDRASSVSRQAEAASFPQRATSRVPPFHATSPTSQTPNGGPQPHIRGMSTPANIAGSFERHTPSSMPPFFGDNRGSTVDPHIRKPNRASTGFKAANVWYHERSSAPQN